MPDYTIKSATAEGPLFAGNFRNFSECIETAFNENIDLRAADLRHCNLQNASLDGIDLTGSCLEGANLSGANLSESILDNVIFDNAILHSAVLCQSKLRGAQFDGTLFGATEIVDAQFEDCLFSTLSAFTLRFNEAGTFRNCRYINPCGTICYMSRAPVVMTGLSQQLVLMDHYIKIGHSVFALDDVPDWIASGGLNPRNLRLRIEQILLALMMDDKSRKIA